MEWEKKIIHVSQYMQTKIPAECYLTMFIIEINTTRHCIPSTQSLTTAKLKNPRGFHRAKVSRIAAALSIGRPGSGAAAADQWDDSSERSSGGCTKLAFLWLVSAEFRGARWALAAATNGPWPLPPRELALGLELSRRETSLCAGTRLALTFFLCSFRA